MGETEEGVIHDALTRASEFYKDQRTPAEGSLEAIEAELYESLFGFRDRIGETPLNRPVKFPLEEIFKELKYGRPAESQKQLDEFIRQLENKSTNQ